MTSYPPTRDDGKRKKVFVAQHSIVEENYRGRLRTFSTSRTKAGIMFWLAVFQLISVTNAIEYANQWTVDIHGGDEVANDVARIHGFVNMGRLFEDGDVYMFIHHSVMKRSLTTADEHHSKLTSHKAVRSAEQQIIRKRVKRDLGFDPEKGLKDPLWTETWYLLPETKPSMRVTEAWEAGYTGKDVVVTILDDGIEYEHPDLADNYDKNASRDINGGDDDPEPRPTYNNENRHGTRCAGEVAASANNDYCSVGIAFNAKIGGVRMLDGQVTDMVEAASIGLRPGHIDIYSASWGPDDDGRTVDGPARRAKEAFEKGVTIGRGGKGSIFVWASGNGGRKDDNCNCDGYTNSIYTLSISSTTENTNKPWYSEDCSSTLATTYSSGVSTEKQIVTTDLSGHCTTSHTGTSASAPLAAGICALALEANPNLTWRDMQHLVVRTANPDSLHASDWAVNGVGRKVSHSYGYGLMDAYSMVTMAKDWQTVPAQKRCNITVITSTSSRDFNSDNPIRIPFSVSGCEGVMPNRLEHVQAEISATSNRRGDLYIYLTSPMGTKSTLLDARKLDDKQDGFTKWPFMTTHSWDENPDGQWILEIRMGASRVHGRGSLTFFQLVMYGTLDVDWPSGGLLHPGTSVDETIEKVTTTTSSRAGVGKTTMMDATVKPMDVEVTTGGCKTAAKSGAFCLVCEDGFIRSVDKKQCLKTCPMGQFASVESEDEKIPRATNEDLMGVKICKPCAAGPYCTSCDGPTVSHCLTCVDGFKISKGQCILDPSGPLSQSQNIYVLSVAVCVLSVVVFIFLFIFLQCCRKRGQCCSDEGSKTRYTYIPNHDDINEDPFGGPELKITNGRRINGFKKGHVENGITLDSDDERT